MKKINVFLAVLACCVSVVGHSQKLDMSLFEGIKPRNVGPAGMSGRITTIDVVNDQPDVIYVGSASGGLWKSTSGGIKWEALFDREATASIGAVAIDQSNPSVVWVGTGEGNPRNSLNGGAGIYRSLDAGKTWQNMGLKNTMHIHKIIVDPRNSNVVYVGAIGSPWGEHPERGVYKTTDGGKTWAKILFVNNKTGVADMIMDPTNPNKIIVALWEHKRDPWFFKSGGPGSGLYVTVDGGANWKQITSKDGLPEGELGRIGLAMATNKPHIVYALVESKKNALYKSEDGGYTWKKVNDKPEIGDRPFYYSDLYVDPQNENRVYSVFTYVHVSEDGGRSFAPLMPAYGVSNGVHPDHHAWWIHPKNGQYMMDGNDGGMNITRDGGKSWRFVGNIPVGQFYHVNTDNEFPYNLYGGMQDNGSWRGPAYVWKDQGIRNSYWQEISFGDGFDVVPDQEDARYGYTMSQQGSVSRYDWVTGNNYSVKPTPPDADTKLRFNWNSAIGQDPFDNNTVYFGSQFVHKSTDKGLTWTIISPDLTTNDPEKLKQSESGGLTMDATGAENHCTILVIEPSAVQKNFMWVGTDDGRVHWTNDSGKSWTEVTQNIKGLPKGSWIPQIKADPKIPGAALLVANDYRRFNHTPYLFRTKDYGKTWERIGDATDFKSFVLSVVQDPEAPQLIFAGTDDGLYVSIDQGTNWTKWTSGFPTVPTSDLVVQKREGDLAIATFGRSMWVLDDLRPLRSLAQNPSLLTQPIALFKAPKAYLAAYQQPTGSRFGADAMYQGDNRPSGGQITYYYGQKEASKDTLKLHVYQGDELIRTLTLKTPKAPGFQRITWDLDRKSGDRPSRSAEKPKTERGGRSVLPGTYRLELVQGTHKSEATIEVGFDPRLEVSAAAEKEKDAALAQIDQWMDTAAQAVRQLVQSQQTAKELAADMKKEDAKGLEEKIKQSEKISESLEELIAQYLGKQDKRQGITRSPEMTVVQRLGSASSYISSRPNGVTSTETQLMDLAKKSLQDALKAQNEFFETTWKEFHKQVENWEQTRFKPTKTFNLVP